MAGNSDILKKSIAADYVSVLCAEKKVRKSVLTVLNCDANEKRSCIIIAQFLNRLGF